jgi:predicted AlkP superfamily pyrophosphatase or phosphodiesterase
MKSPLKRRLQKTLLTLLWMLLCLAAVNPVAAADLGCPSKNVILISWDGCDRSVFKELLADGKLPNAAAIVQEGSLQDIEVTGHATCTKPGHAQLLTGLEDKVSGVVNNSNYQAIPEGYTIFERIQQQVGPDKVRMIMVTAKVDNLGGRSADEILASAKQSGKKLSPGEGEKGEPYYLAKNHLDVFDAVNRDVAQTGATCLQHLEPYQNQRFFAFFHFAEPDRSGHKFGSASPEYRQGVVSCDEWLGKIVAWLKQRNLYEQTLLYVTCDHGFDPNSRGHSNAPHIWLITNDKGVTHGGIQADVPATILSRFGVDLDKLEPKLIGQPLL